MRQITFTIDEATGTLVLTSGVLIGEDTVDVTIVNSTRDWPADTYELTIKPDKVYSDPPPVLASGWTAAGRNLTLSGVSLKSDTLLTYLDTDAQKAVMVAIDGLTETYGIGHDIMLQNPVRRDGDTAPADPDANTLTDAQIAALYATIASLANYIPLLQKAVANGVASLGADGKVPEAQLPASATEQAVETVAGVSPVTKDIPVAGLLTALGLGRSFQKSAAPTVNDDSTQGYAFKDLWFDTVNGEQYRCFDATEGAADWKKATLTLDELGALASLSEVTEELLNFSDNTSADATISWHGLMSKLDKILMVFYSTAPYAHATTAGALTIDTAHGPVQELTPSGAISFTPANFNSTKSWVELLIINTGGQAIDTTGWNVFGALPSGASTLWVRFSVRADGATYDLTVGQELAT